MKKTLIAIGTILTLGFAGNVNALMLHDTTYFTKTGTIAPEDYVDHGFGDVNWLSSPSLFKGFDFVKWEHQFTFDPKVDTINSATLEVTFWDDERDNRFWKKEFGYGYAESGDWDLGEVDTGSYTYNVGVSSLYDGSFGVTVRSIAGDFGIKSSKLTIDYNPAPVPEPSTMLLFGAGLAGLVGYNRRRKN